MLTLKKVNWKAIIIPTIVIIILTSICITITTKKQYEYLTDTVNIEMAKIIEIIKKEYPEASTEQILKIINSDIGELDYQNGKNELKKYGIQDNINTIKAMQEQMERNIKINVIIIIFFNILWIMLLLIYFYKRDKKVREITKYINEINNKNYQLDIEENSEDELSNLKNELYKITIMLKEESENSQKDKENLKISVQDISHQLKTPLTSISIMLDNLKLNPNMEENTRKKFIFEISRQIEWINWLVISMLKLSRLDANVVNFNSEEINVKQCIQEIIKNLEIPIEIRNQKIYVDGNADVSFMGDYKWQKEAITNVIKNCIEHNEEGKCIYIKFEENNLYTKISIKDEGEGIKREDIKHIFERFYKGANSSENSVGIGLALAKSIIEKDNGMVSCISEVGKGTEFVVKFMK